MTTSQLLKDKAAEAAAAMIAEGQTLRQINATNFFVATTVPDGYSCWDEFSFKDQTIFIVWEKEV
jgi:hypothetical protein